MSQWYWKQDQRLAGPFSFDELKFLALRGELGSDDFVRLGTDGQWQSPLDVEGLLSQQKPQHPKTEPPSTAEPDEPTEAEQPETVPDVVEEPAPRKPLPPPLPTRTRTPDERRRMILGAGFGALVALLMLLLIFLLFNLFDRPTGGIADGRGSGQGRQQGQGEGTGGAGSSEPGQRRDEGEAPREPAPGTDGDVEREQTRPPEEEVDEQANESGDESNQDDSEPMPEEGGAAPPLEDPPEQPGFKIRKVTEVDELRPEDEILGGGQVGGQPAAMFEGRTEEQRQQLAEQEGGSPESEAAVELGLEWLAAHQEKDGHWSLNEFHMAQDCNGQCDERRGGAYDSDTAATGMALMPFLGAGYTHLEGKHKTTVYKGLVWLKRDQNPEGTFQGRGQGNMYAHGQASIALCEAFAMTRDKSLQRPAQKALDYIVKAQHKQGGWRYGFQVPGDTSVMGWQILAIRSGQAGRLRVPRELFRKANLFLDSVQVDKAGGQYRYQPRGRESPSMVAEGLLCRMYCTAEKNAPGIEAGVEYLMNHLPNKQQRNIYLWYYATQVMHHAGGPEWRQWNEAMRDTLVELQVKEGHKRGSWDPVGGHAPQGGRIYFTALALCTLEVYYRHAALYD